MSTMDPHHSSEFEPTQPDLEVDEADESTGSLGLPPYADQPRAGGPPTAANCDGLSGQPSAKADWTVSGADSLELSRDTAGQGRRRRVRLPVILFVATCLSTFWAGANHWLPLPIGPSVRQMVLAHWSDGVIYMVCVLAILLTHEMGHFLMTLRYHIPASLPYFIPFPISPIGTMGAVIGMDGLRANRREMFDIGLAGPLAGLLVAVPIMCYGISQLDLTRMDYGPFAVDLPLFARIAMQYIQPPGYMPGKLIWYSQLNPYFMAGWVGFLITGLNMLPVSQLDGGHVIYTLFGKRAHWIARLFVLLAVVFVVISRQWNWMLMIALVLFIGTDHPPTSDDRMALGRVRTVIGCLAVLIPIFCFAPWLFVFPD